ncbi:MAG: polysaccharide deacetylase family protein [Acidithiobacillales bacterium]
MNLALKVDVDTYRGTLEGVPRLLDLFAKEGIRATFFFSLGPDNTGKALRRVFRKGFVRKVLSASPSASYGLTTMLYGTILPAPDIGADPAAVRRMREAAAAGHAAGIHAWDHVDWHDRLPSMSRDAVLRTFGRAAERFAQVFGERARLAAAPGWTANGISVEAYEAHGIEVSSDTRGGAPFHPLLPDGTPSKILEIPSTLPTLDELLALPLPGTGSRAERACGFLRMKMREREDGAARGAGARPVADPAGRLQVHSVHTEIEGGPAFLGAFSRLIGGWRRDGVRFLGFDELREILTGSGKWPVKGLTFKMVPGRATPVASGKEAE